MGYLGSRRRRGDGDNAGRYSFMSALTGSVQLRSAAVIGACESDFLPFRLVARRALTDFGAFAAGRWARVVGSGSLYGASHWAD
jgi:hypothetical protein